MTFFFKLSKYVLFIMLLSFSTLSYSTEIGTPTANQVALNFMNSKMGYNLNSTDISSVDTIFMNGQIVIYAVNFNQNLGFVLVSADTRVSPVLGFVPGIEYGIAENQPIAFKNLVFDYSKQIQDARIRNLAPGQRITDLWQTYIDGSTFKAPSNSVGPLLTSIWSQGCGFNDSCPADPSGPCQNAVTGCVATAMAQVMNFHNWPPNGSGSHSYNSNYGPLTANFAATSYNWNLMPDTVNSSTPANMVAAMAQLISQCGISVDMMYSAGSSGAYSEDAERAFVHFFNYDPSLKMLYRDNYPDSIWNLMLIYELDNQRPMYYDGSGSGGHAFVCDGYQAGEFFHFNWGWNGGYNGYFLATNLNPGGMNFSMYNSAIFGMKPFLPQVCSGQTNILTSKSGHISDGSSYQNYSNNTNCSWLIQPTNSVLINLEFYDFNLASGDTVFVFDGQNSSSPLIGKYYLGHSPSLLSSSGGSLFIAFTTDGTSISQGWSASYRSEFCGGTSILTSPSGLITDGSGSDFYNNAVNCSWLISAPGSISIELNFTSFNTEAGFDYVHIYDGQNANGQLLGTFSGSNLPQAISANSGYMFINFVTDGGVVDQGWEASYVVCNNLPSPIASSTMLCIGDSVLLVAPSAQNNIDWYFGPVSFANGDSVFVTAAGNYSYRTNSSFCGNLVSPFISINHFPNPNFSLPADTTICVYSSLNLDYPGFGAYNWFDGGTNSNNVLSDSNLNLGPNSVWLEIIDSNGCIYADTTIITLDICEGISENQNVAFNVFPTITNDFLYISSIDGSGILVISVYSIDGKLIESKQVDNEIYNKIDVKLLEKGSYFVEITSSEKLIRLPFIKI